MNIERPRCSLLIAHCSLFGAFTLVELLVGMVIMTMILGAAATVYVTMMRGWKSGSGQYRRMQVAQAVSQTMERYLRAAVPPAACPKDFVFHGESLPGEDTEGHRLTFISSASGRLPFAGQPLSDLTKVTFFLDPDDDDGRGFCLKLEPLHKNVVKNEEEDRYEPVELSRDVANFRVLYYNGSKWKEDWNQKNLPLAVEFHLSFAAEEDEVKGQTKENEAPETRRSRRTMGKEREGAASSSSSAGGHNPEQQGEMDDDESADTDLTISRLLALPLRTETMY